MSSVLIVCNKIDGKDYRISIVPVRKSISIPNPLTKLFPKGTVYENSGEKVGGEPITFDNIIFEAAIFYKKDFFKPLVSIEFNDTDSEIQPEGRCISERLEKIVGKRQPVV